MYKIRNWSLPGAAVKLFWKAMLEGILCDVFLQKCSAAWQGAPGQRLTVAIMLARPPDGR